jgi:tRNA A-37 threonylcarbamoyl transferase component Bud32
LAQDPYLGRQILGQYHIEKKLGEGGMGMVYQADQPAMQRKAAIKILRKEIASPEQIERFQREAQALANMDHPHIVKVYNYGTLDDGALYMAMEFVQGREVDKELQKCGRMEWRRGVGCVIQVADALVEAHHNGVVHRDLKPENILLTEWRDATDFVKVLDFGIAKVLENAQHLESSATIAGVIHGTPQYMSPEQARGDTLDHRSDIYSLGIVLYAMLTGDLPIKSNTLVGYIIAHQQDPPAPLTQYVQDAPKELERIILKMLEKDPATRFQTMQETLDALTALVAPPPVKRTGMKIALAGGLVLLFVAVGVIAWLATQKPKEIKVGLKAGVVDASDNKRPKWVSTPLTSRGEMTLVVGAGIAETKSDAGAKARVAAQLKILEQVGKLITGESVDEVAFRRLFEAAKGKVGAPDVMEAAMKASPFQLGEANATYWSKFQPEGDKAGEYRYWAQHRIKLRQQLSAKIGALEARTKAGIRVIPFFPSFAAVLGVPMGVLATKVKAGGLADKSGLKVGDVITRIDGKEIPDPVTYSRSIKVSYKRMRKTGDPVQIEVVRLEEGAPKTNTIELIK